MTIDTEFLSMMPLSVTFHPYTGEDAFGNNTYGTTFKRNARPENPTRTMEGTVLVGAKLATEPDTVRLIIDYVSTGVVQERYKAVIGSKTYIVVSAITEYDENGPYYQDLTCQNNKEN